jgi:phosphonopyruvate decarboxylase
MAPQNEDITATDSRLILDALLGLGFDFFTGVPCSDLGGLFRALEESNNPKLVTATSEGEALSIACGAFLAGKKPVVLCQNSGLGNLINPLLSHCTPHQIPILVIMSWRGHPEMNDEPQHAKTGSVTKSLLEHIGYAYMELDVCGESFNLNELQEIAKTASEPYFFLIRPGQLAKARQEHLRPRPHQNRSNQPPLNPHQTDAQLTRTQAIKKLLEAIGDEDIIVSSVGFNSRTLFSLKDRELNYYVPGAMGFAGAIGLGIALSKPLTRVIVIDGDGSALMHLGNFATMGTQPVPNFDYVVLNNAMHESTGGQPTSGSSVDFNAVAHACGFSVHQSIEHLSTSLLKGVLNLDGKPNFLEVKTERDPQIRPARPDHEPAFYTKRFLATLKSNVS